MRAEWQAFSLWWCVIIVSVQSSTVAVTVVVVPSWGAIFCMRSKASRKISSDCVSKVLLFWVPTELGVITLSAGSVAYLVTNQWKLADGTLCSTGEGGVKYTGIYEPFLPSFILLFVVRELQTIKVTIAGSVAYPFSRFQCDTNRNGYGK